jgi:DNA-binding NtrC family response regulator
MPTSDENPAASDRDTPAHALIIGARSLDTVLVVARRLHGARGRGPFVHVPWTLGQPATLAESEIFGHVRNGFRGAFRDKPGALELAAGGTLLLEHLDELPARVAEQLTCALVTGRASRIGSPDADYPVDVSVVATVSRPLDGRLDPILTSLCAHFTIIDLQNAS